MAKHLVIKAKGGMGNRMLCAATGLIYAQLTERIPFVDWRDESYSVDGSNVFTNLFECTACGPGPPEDSRSVLPAVWRGCLDRSMSWMVQRHHPTKHSSIRIHRKYSVDVRRADYVDDVVVFWYYTHRVGALRGLCQRLGSKYASMSNEAMLQDALRHMPLHRLVRERLEEFKSCWWSRPVIGVHVRHTDRQTDVDRYWRPLRAFLQRDPQATVFVATDDIGVLQLYERQVPRVISTPKWYPKQGSMHQNKACPNRLENAVEALVDMYLLAECDYLIYPGGSTFSWVSHLLSDIPPGHVVDIERRDPIVWGKRLLRQFSA